MTDAPLFLGPFGADADCLRTVIAWLNNPDVVRYSENRHRQHTLETQRSYILSLDPQDIYWGIFLGKKLIGTISAHVDKHNSVANMGIMVGDKSQWGKGYGYEAWNRVGNFLFLVGVRKIEAGCMAANKGMMAICQKYGMVEEGRQDKHFRLGETTTDLVHWGKFNETG